jgi:hypothetical protein
MHKLTLMLAVGAVGVLAVLAASRTEAAGPGADANSLRIASDDVSAIQKVQYGWRGGPAYGYVPAYGIPDYNSHPHLGDGAGIGIQRNHTGYSDSAFGFSPTGSISDGR